MPVSCDFCSRLAKPHSLCESDCKHLSPKEEGQHRVGAAFQHHRCKKYGNRILRHLGHHPDVVALIECERGDDVTLWSVIRET